MNKQILIGIVAGGWSTGTLIGFGMHPMDAMLIGGFIGAFASNAGYIFGSKSQVKRENTVDSVNYYELAQEDIRGGTDFYGQKFVQRGENDYTLTKEYREYLRRKIYDSEE